MITAVVDAGKAIVAALSWMESEIQRQVPKSLAENALRQAHFEMVQALLHARMSYKLSANHNPLPAPEKPPAKKGRKK